MACFDGCGRRTVRAPGFLPQAPAGRTSHFLALNIHHLELFYYVARHGGISEAARKMPYGIQQPAVSAQILQLESALGVSLFQRRPFCLTGAGDKLYRFIQPFFQNLGTIAEEIRGGSARTVRIGASDVILRDHLPGLIQRLRTQFPSTRLILRSGYQPDLLDWLHKQELDFALTLLDTTMPSHFQAEVIFTLPLVLLAPRQSRIQTAGELWQSKRVAEPLLCLPPAEVLCRRFQETLRVRGIEWPPALELSSLELIETYVENDYGFGLSLGLPGKRRSRRIRQLPLPGFPTVEFGLIWQGEPTPLLKSFLQEARRRARQLARPPEAPPPRARRAARERR